MPLNKSPDYKIGSKAGRINKLDLYQQRLLETNTSRADFTIEQINDYAEIYQSTPLWHGSGRYQYDSSGSITDVFTNILAQDGFTPWPDLYDLSADMTILVINTG